MGLFSKIGDALGSFGEIISPFTPLIGGGLSLLGGAQDRKGAAQSDALSSQRQKENTAWTFRDQWGFKKQRGLTPQEIVGTPTSQAPVTSNTLGNNQKRQQALQQTAQLGFQAQENEKDRRNRLEVATIQQRAPLEQAQTGRDTFQLKKELQPHVIKNIEQSIRQSQATSAKTRFEFENAWALKMSTMSAENVLTALTMAVHGADIEAILKATKQGPKARADAIKIINELRTYQSHVGKEALGALEIIKVGVTHALGEGMKDIKGIGRNFREYKPASKPKSDNIVRIQSNRELRK